MNLEHERAKAAVKFGRVPQATVDEIEKERRDEISARNKTRGKEYQDRIRETWIDRK